MEKEEHIKYGPDSLSQMEKESEEDIERRERERKKWRERNARNIEESKKLPGARQRGRGIQCQQNDSLMPTAVNSSTRPIQNKSILYGQLIKLFKG